MTKITERIPKRIQYIFWVKVSDKNNFLPKNIKKFGQQILEEFKFVSDFESFHSFKDKKSILVKAFSEFNLTINSYPKSELICVEISSLSVISKEKVNKVISKVFIKSIWIRNQ